MTTLQIPVRDKRMGDDPGTFYPTIAQLRDALYWLECHFPNVTRMLSRAENEAYNNLI